VKSYGISKVQGDRYAVGFHSAEWRSHGIEFLACETSTSENYLRCLPLLLAGRVRMVDSITLRNQFVALERKPGDNARETVSHPAISNAHDDVCCAVAGAIVATMPGDGTYPLELWQKAFNPESLDPHEPVRYQYADATSAPLIPSDMRMQYERTEAAMRGRTLAPIPAPTHEEITRIFAQMKSEGRL
jgi:hypothetical protein